MMQPTVLLTDSDLGDRDVERSWLVDALDARVIVADCRSEADVMEQVQSARPHAIVTQWAPVTKSVIAAATECTIISRIGIGVDMIDLEAAAIAGIEVKNVPHYCTEEVAAHTVALALALWRRLPQLDAELRGGRWHAAAHAPHIGRLSKTTVGLIGCGRIGSLVARAFQALGSEVIVVDPAVATPSLERVTLSDLAQRADIICLHAPLLESTRHTINRDVLNSMTRAPVLINTSRGGLVDVPAAVEAVIDGRLRGLGLDVFEEEPLPADHPVLGAPNTLITAHAAWCSQDALPDLRRGAIENVIEALRTRDQRAEYRTTASAPDQTLCARDQRKETA